MGMFEEDFLYGSDEDCRDCEPQEHDFLEYSEIVVRTSKAICFRTKRGDTWVPKSQIKINEKEKFFEFPVWMNLTFSHNHEGNEFKKFKS